MGAEAPLGFDLTADFVQASLGDVFMRPKSASCSG